MKLYKFYKKPDNEHIIYDDIFSVKDKYPLYAFTNNKEFCQIFINQRNMEKFIMITSKVTKEEFVDYANTNRACMLDMNEYMHLGEYVNKKRIRTNSKKVRILSTWQEKEMCEQGLEDSAITLSEYVEYVAIPYLFKKKYIDALSLIEYTSFWKLVGNSETVMDILNDGEESDMDYSAPNVLYDEFKIFIKLHGYTFK